MRIIEVDSCNECPYCRTREDSNQELHDDCYKFIPPIEIPYDALYNRTIWEKCPLETPRQLIRQLQNKDDTA